MPIVDSSVLVAFINRSDALHARARALDLAGGSINQLVFCEVANVLSKRVGDKTAVIEELKRVLQTIPVLSLGEDEVWDALAFFTKHYPKLSFTDASLLAQSRRTGQEIVTFDKFLSKAVEKEQ